MGSNTQERPTLDDLSNIAAEWGLNAATRATATLKRHPEGWMGACCCAECSRPPCPRRHVSDETLGFFYFAAPRMKPERLRHFLNHPDERIAKRAREILDRHEKEQRDQ